MRKSASCEHTPFCLSHTCPTSLPAPNQALLSYFPSCTLFFSFSSASTDHLFSSSSCLILFALCLMPTPLPFFRWWQLWQPIWPFSTLFFFYFFSFIFSILNFITYQKKSCKDPNILFMSSITILMDMIILINQVQLFYSAKTKRNVLLLPF